MLDLKINHLQLLAQIVSTGSLTEAAQNLGLSAAAASRMLKKLQTEMNDPLFIRVWRGLTPTDTTTMMKVFFKAPRKMGSVNSSL